MLQAYSYSTPEAASESCQSSNQRARTGTFCWRSLTSGQRRSRVREVLSILLCFCLYFRCCTHKNNLSVLAHSTPVCALPSRPQTLTLLMILVFSNKNNPDSYCNLLKLQIINFLMASIHQIMIDTNIYYFNYSISHRLNNQT